MTIQEPEHGSFLTLSLADGVATLVIDRERRKNAMTQAMWRDMARLFEEFSSDAALRAVVLKGAGSDFCAGADISEFDTVRADAQSAMAYEAQNDAAFAAIRNCPVPTIAAIRGICFGGGFGLAAACDIRLATQDALFSVPAARLGLAYPVDAMTDIVHAAGPQMAKYLAYSGARIEAAAALRAGFLLDVVEDIDLERRVSDLAALIAINAPISVRASKASIGAVLSGDASMRARAVELGDQTFESSDYAEGRAAFREKRAARFRGR